MNLNCHVPLEIRSAVC